MAHGGFGGAYAQGGRMGSGPGMAHASIGGGYAGGGHGGRGRR
jgi:hypothetical protein